MQGAKSHHSSCSKISLNAFAKNELKILKAHAATFVSPLICVLNQAKFVSVLFSTDVILPKIEVDDFWLSILM